MRTFVIASLVFMLSCGFALAQEEPARDRAGARPERVDQALKERYGQDATVEIVGTPTELNGVKLFRVQIRDKRGDSTALVTEYGDFMLSGMPSEFEGLPEAVRATQDLFTAAPRDAETFIADGYYIDMEQDSERFYRLRYDAVGRLREIANPDEVERFETTNFEKADEGTARKVRETADKHIPQGSKIRDVYIDPRFPGFYVSKYEGPKGGEVLVISDEQGNIYQTRTEVDRGELPPPVRESFRRMFDEGKMKYTYRTQYQFYQFQQQTPQGEQLTFRVRPTGSIMEVQNVSADREDEAVTAQYRRGEGRTTGAGPQPAERPRDRDRDRNRDRD